MDVQRSDRPNREREHPMYKHILIATDGSETANKAIPHAIELTKAFGATLSAVTVTEPYEAVAIPQSSGLMLPAEYKKQCDEIAANILSTVTSAAEAAGIKCDAFHQDNRLPYVGIIEAAEKVGADLIVLSSHGRRGIAGLLLGSEATKLLTHTKVPALVVR
jgi:nucleotide-binding universal stress UspA family protein